MKQIIYLVHILFYVQGKPRHVHTYSEGYKPFASRGAVSLCSVHFFSPSRSRSCAKIATTENDDFDRQVGVRLSDRPQLR